MWFASRFAFSFLFVLLVLCLDANAAVTTEFRFERQWPLLDSAWSLNQPSEVATDPNNNLYVVDTYNHRVQAFNASGNFIRSFGSEGSGPGQLLFPADVAVNSNGVVFVLDNGNNRIQVFDANGSWIKSIGGAGSKQGQFNLPKPNFTQQGKPDKQGAIALDRIEQLLYVADAGNNRIQVLNTQGEYLYSLGDGQLKQPNGLEVDQYTGMLYVADTGNQRVLIYTLDRKQLLLNWKFSLPAGIAVNEVNGDFYVANRNDQGYSEIVVFDSNGMYKGTIGTAYQLVGATGLAVNLDGALYVADTGHLIVQWLNASTGAFQWYFGNSAPFSWLFDYVAQVYGSNSLTEAFNGYFYLPVGVKAAPNGNLYVADAGNNRIQWFDADGKFLGKFGTAGSGNGAFILPTSVAISADNSVFVTDSNNHRIQKFSLTGQFQGTFGSFGSGAGQFNSPADIAIANNQQIYIVDSQNHRIQVFAQNGKFLKTWGKLGQGNGEFNAPTGIALAPDGSVYVGDTDNNRVQQFTADGVFIRSFGRAGTGNGEFNAPARIVVAPDNTVFVVDADNNRIQQFTAEGTFLQIIGGGGVTEGQFRSPTALALGADNSLYIADGLNSRIQKLKPNVFVPVQKSVRHPFKAIILAGGGADNNPLWDTTQILANRAFTTLRAQGFQKDEIAYLTSGNTQMDLDSNGNNTDDLLPANLANLQTALTEWASDANDVVVYLIDHGGPGTFKVNANDILSREQLGTWLQTLESKLPKRAKVTLIVEACKSASFFNGLPAAAAEKKRTLIASANTEQPALLSNQGLISFSYYFWSEVRAGAKLQDAFKTARQGMSTQEVVVGEKIQRQAAQLDVNGDGVLTDADYNTLGNDCLGNCITTAGEEPEIKGKTADTTLRGETKLALKADFSSLEPLTRAWVSISRPDSKHADSNQPVSDLPSLALNCSAQNNGMYSCQGEYTTFDTKGRYALTFYAQDKNNRTSAPSASIITQSVGKEAPVLTSAEQTRYIADANEVILEDVLVGGQHFWAKLHDQGGLRFTVVDYHASTVQENPAAQFVPDTQTLTIPKIVVGNSAFRVVMQASGGVFSVKDAVALP